MENKKFLSSLEQSEWFEYIHLIIKYSTEIAIKLKVKYLITCRKITRYLFTAQTAGIARLS